MLVLIIWAVALGLALVVLAVLGYGLLGQFKRLRRAVAAAEADAARVAALRSDQADTGRHRA